MASMVGAGREEGEAEEGEGDLSGWWRRRARR